jgi:hypothetical protein
VVDSVNFRPNDRGNLSNSYKLECFHQCNTMRNWVDLFKGEIGYMVQDKMLQDERNLTYSRQWPLTSLLRLYSSCRELYESEAKLKIMRKLKRKPIHPVYTRRCKVRHVGISFTEDLVLFWALDDYLKEIEGLSLHSFNSGGNLSLVPFQELKQLKIISVYYFTFPNIPNQISGQITEFGSFRMDNLLYNFAKIRNLKILKIEGLRRGNRENPTLQLDSVTKKIEELQLTDVCLKGEFHFPNLKNLTLIYISQIPWASISNCQNLEKLDLRGTLRQDDLNKTFLRGFPNLVQLGLYCSDDEEPVELNTCQSYRDWLYVNFMPNPSCHF